MKYLVFSHGFGVSKDSNGMFTDIARSLSEYRPIMFDYNEIYDDKGLTKVYSYKRQAKLLNTQINKIYKKDPKAEVVVVAHSQGAIVAGLCKQKIAKVILLAPPTTVSARRSKLRPNRRVRKDGSVMIYKKNGSRILLTAGFMWGLKLTNPIKIYDKLASRTPTFIIAAKQDEMIRRPDFSALKNAKIYTINGDHNFSGDNRKSLISTIYSILIRKF